MRHYELVLLIHPDKADSMKDLISEYKKLIAQGGGKVHRCEESGKRELAYTIAGTKHAYYLVINIEVVNQTLDKLKHELRFNESVIRSLITVCNSVVTGASPLIVKQAQESTTTSVKKPSAK
jgi:small subunit ribosomal protein S6